MSWSLLATIVLGIAIAIATSWLRRHELHRMSRAVRTRQQVRASGVAKSRLRHPIVDLSRCLGCGTCVTACPEEGVLELVHGQAAVVHAARCVGHGVCEAECPVGAITVTLADLETRTDVPVLDASLQAVGTPGLHLAGEVTAHALIKTAVEQGVAVAREVAAELEAAGPAADAAQLDLCIVGAGPAGLACALEAKRLGLRARIVELEAELGGTVAKYPRRKLVVSQPVDLPMAGRIGEGDWTKEELIALLTDVVARFEIDIAFRETFVGVDGSADAFVVRTDRAAHHARRVCLAIGRRGVPNRLGVPGEELPKVAYALLDAHSYQGRRVLVVGGGDSAVETALALAEQNGNEVTLSYRREQFTRLRAENERRLGIAIAEKRLRVVRRSTVVRIDPDAVELSVTTDAGTKRGRIANDDVFVMAGGVAPFELLGRSGVSFDPSMRPPPPKVVEKGSGFVRALWVGLVLALATASFAFANFDYYSLPTHERATHDQHAWLRPGLGFGLAMGITALALIAFNLLYLLRRAGRLGFTFGSLQAWMSTHVATGVLALLCVLLHAAMSPRNTPGGHAFWALVVLLVTGAIGRWFYAQVPRAANGRELELAEVKERLDALAAEWDGDRRAFRMWVRTSVDALVEARQWRSTFFGRLLALFGMHGALRRLLQQIAARGHAEGIASDDLEDTLLLARRAYSIAIDAAHFEDLRSLLATWRWLHRWTAALMVLLVIVHVVHALAYGSFLSGGGAF
jgi:thioredoxin reductase/Pyruvate/2-oxoacid:ferredoxin oxidoreductase delta subunit